MPSLCPRGQELRLNWYDLFAACHKMDGEMALQMYRAHLRACPECSDYLRRMNADIRTRPANAEEIAEGGVAFFKEPENELFIIEATA